MNASSRCNGKTSNQLIGIPKRAGTGRKSFLPALIAVGGGCALFGGPAAGLELGEMQVQSTLGQPLRASVAYALNPNERIHDYCIYLKPGPAASGLPSISNASVTVTGGTIRLTGRTAVREPLLALQLTVDCPNTAHLRRDYAVFVNPGLPSDRQSSVPAAAMRSTEPTTVPHRQVAAAAARPALRTPIESAESYRVQAGDTLSGIAQRISGRTVAIWPAVDAIFAANPDAFINNDRNRLRAGAVLAIPDSIRAPRAASTAADPELITPAGSAGIVRPAEERATAPASAARNGPAEAAPVPVTRRTVEPVSTPERTNSPQPGDAVAPSDSPFVSPVEAETDASAAAPTQAKPELSVQAVSRQNLPVVPGASGNANPSWSWLFWLGGSGVALILALLLFGRRLKESFAPGSSVSESPARRRTDTNNLDDTDVSPVLGLPAQGSAPVARMISLDADLDDGAGLQYGGDIDVAQDFGFSADSCQFESGLDLDVGAAGVIVEEQETDVIAPNRLAEGGILVSETPPQRDDSGEYDVSMIVDATRQEPDDSDDTTKDLRAIEVEAEGDYSTSGGYARNQDVDYRILEQDYEDELTSTQALSAELAKAARALSRQYGKDEMGDTLAETLSEEASDLDTQVLLNDDSEPADEETTAMPAAGTEREAPELTLDETANEEIAAELPAAENDATVEVEIETATIDTRKMRA